MGWRCLSLMAFLVAAPLSAETPFAPQIHVPHIDDHRLAKIRQGGRVYFYHTSLFEGCPALTDKCRRKGYVVPGDLVLMSQSKGLFVYIDYVKDGEWTAGWILRTTIVEVPTPPVSFASWIGNWRWRNLDHDSADFEIKRDKRQGFLAVEGFAIWASRIPGEYDKGNLHTGELDDSARPNGRHIVFGKRAHDYGECQAEMELIGPYLIADDNDQCGGLNVTFSGVYRKD